MGFFRNVFLDNSDASQLPDLYQCNGEPINPLLRQYIFDGEPCEYSKELKTALEKYILRDRVINIFVIVFMSFAIIKVLPECFKSEKTDTMFALLFTLFMCIVSVIIIVFSYREFANITALKKADSGHAKCFRYTFYGISRYEIDPQDGTSLYFANLGEFLVKVSAADSYPIKVCGLVINIKGTEHFYLLG